MTMEYSRSLLVSILCMMCFSYSWAQDKSEFEGGLAVDSSHNVRVKDYQLEGVSVVASSVKESRPPRESALSSSTFSMEAVSSNVVTSVKDLSASIPNFYQPDYGSKMTSSIYIRGLGARIDQPVMGLNVDNVPYMNKNNYDFDLFDIARMEMLRGPQGTMYGRNTMCGVMNVYTLSPLYYKGMRFEADYSSGNTAKLKGSVYRRTSDKFGYSVAASYDHTDGFHTNEYDGEKCDGSDAAAVRARMVWQPKKNWMIDNSLSFGVVSQGGYAYALYDTTAKKSLPVNYNDETSYERFSLIEGLSLRYTRDQYVFSSVTSYQFLDDEMNLDQDFTPRNVFTLTQAQTEHAFTQDFVLKSTREGVWNWSFGLWGFYKNVDMTAPVTFKRGGIEDLILNNANKGIQSIFPADKLDIKEQEFIVHSHFDMPTWGTALYHQSEFEVGKWLLMLGLRVDYERASMTYRNHADINYYFSYLMNDYKPLQTAMAGRESNHFVELLPKISLQYNISRFNNVYAYVAKGYKAGGFNTQIFSDLLQNRMMNGMMDELGVHFDGMGVSTYNSAQATRYDPEYSWNYELGGHHTFHSTDLQADWALFYIDCRDQQLTVFPAGKSTGRMMTNAGKSRSWGGEASVTYEPKDWLLSLAYGYTNAAFVDYNDGRSDFSGNRIPYSPSNTLSALAQYTFRLNAFVDKIVARVDGKGVGEIYWDEANSYKQDFYCLMGAGLAFHHKKLALGLWGKNLGGTEYDTFYFRSVGNDFFQAGKPRQLGVSFKCEL